MAERLGVRFALIIASIAVVIAMVGWRAEVAGSRGSDADRRGIVAVTELAAVPRWPRTIAGPLPW